MSSALLAAMGAAPLAPKVSRTPWLARRVRYLTCVTRRVSGHHPRQHTASSGVGPTSTTVGLYSRSMASPSKLGSRSAGSTACRVREAVAPVAINLCIVTETTAARRLTEDGWNSSKERYEAALKAFAKAVDDGAVSGQAKIAAG